MRTQPIQRSWATRAAVRPSAPSSITSRPSAPLDKAALLPVLRPVRGRSDPSHVPARRRLDEGTRHGPRLNQGGWRWPAPCSATCPAVDRRHRSQSRPQRGWLGVVGARIEAAGLLEPPVERVCGSTTLATSPAGERRKLGASAAEDPVYDEDGLFARRDVGEWQRLLRRRQRLGRPSTYFLAWTSTLVNEYPAGLASTTPRALPSTNSR